MALGTTITSFTDRDGVKHLVNGGGGGGQTTTDPIVLYAFGSGPYYFIEETDDQTEKDAFAEQFESLEPNKSYLCMIAFSNGTREYGWLTHSVNQTTGVTTFKVITGMHVYSGSFNDVTSTHTTTDGLWTIADIQDVTPAPQELSVIKTDLQATVTVTSSASGNSYELTGVYQGESFDPDDVADEYYDGTVYPAVVIFDEPTGQSGTSEICRMYGAGVPLLDDDDEKKQVVMAGAICLQRVYDSSQEAWGDWELVNPVTTASKKLFPVAGSFAEASHSHDHIGDTHSEIMVRDGAVHIEIEGEGVGGEVDITGNNLDNLAWILANKAATENHTHGSISSSGTYGSSFAGFQASVDAPTNPPLFKFQFGNSSYAAEITKDNVHLLRSVLMTPDDELTSNGKFVTGSVAYNALQKKENTRAYLNLIKTLSGFEWNDLDDGADEVIGNIIRFGSGRSSICLLNVVLDNSSVHEFVGSISYTKTTDSTATTVDDDTRTLLETYNVTIYVGNTKLTTTLVHAVYETAGDVYTYGSITATTITPIF